MMAMPFTEVTQVHRMVERQGVDGGAGLVEPELLQAKDRLIVLRSGKAPYRVVLGVPHQAAPGSEHICECRLDANGHPQPRLADENAALYALVAFAAVARQDVPCKLVIMAHATTHDPNKVLESPYCAELFAEPARLLFECHGSRAARRLDLELSAGHNRLVDGPAFGRLLQAALDGRYTLGVQQRPGYRAADVYEAGRVRNGSLELPAHHTQSLVEAGRRGLPALHLEARPRFRRLAPGGWHVAEDGRRLGEGLAYSIMLFLR